MKEECKTCSGTGNINKMGSTYLGIENLSKCSRCNGTGKKN